MNDQTKTPADLKPITSFGYPLLKALIQGSKKRYEISGISYRQAVHLRHRCHQLRSRMRKENHPLMKVIAKTKLGIEWDRSKIETLYNKRRVAYPKNSDAPVTLVIEPFDEEFTDMLKAAGFDLTADVDPDHGTAPPTDADKDDPDPKSTLEKLLGDL